MPAGQPLSSVAIKREGCTKGRLLDDPDDDSGLHAHPVPTTGRDLCRCQTGIHTSVGHEPVHEEPCLLVPTCASQTGVYLPSIVAPLCHSWCRRLRSACGHSFPTGTSILVHTKLATPQGTEYTLETRLPEWCTAPASLPSWLGISHSRKARTRSKTAATQMPSPKQTAHRQAFQVAKK